MTNYCDYHNHFGGVLPITTSSTECPGIVELYNKEMNAWPNLVANDSELNAAQKKVWSEYEFLHRASKSSDVLAGMKNDLLNQWGSNNFNKSRTGFFMRLAKYMIDKVKLEQIYDEVDPLPHRGAHVYMFTCIFCLRLVMELAKMCKADGPDINAKVLLEGLESALNDDDFNQYMRLNETIRAVIWELYRFLPQGWQSFSQKEKDRLEAISKRGLSKTLQATKLSPFDDAYVTRSALLKMISPSEYVQASYKFLRQEKIWYSQQSQPWDKIPSESVYDDGFIIDWLSLIASHRDYLAAGGDERFHRYKNDLYKTLTFVQGRPLDVIGIDLAGPEGFLYREEECAKLVEHTHRSLVEILESQPNRKRILFRIHVGEGCALLNEGRSTVEVDPRGFFNVAVEQVHRCFEYDNDDNNSVDDEDFGHRMVANVMYSFWGNKRYRNFSIFAGYASIESKERAHRNISAFLGVISELKRADKWDDRVNVRFGHVTHATAEQAALMAEMGIHADVNLGSNLRTGAIAKYGSIEEAWNAKALGAEGFWNERPEPLMTHPLMDLLDAGVTTVLGTDGQGVEVTRIEEEYKLALAYLKLWTSGDRAEALHDVLTKNADVCVWDEVEWEIYEDVFRKKGIDRLVEILSA